MTEQTLKRTREIEVMRSKILDATKRILLEEGYENVSIRKIASSVSYSPATVYLYFKDKDEIIRELAAEAHSRLFAYLKNGAAQDEQSPVDRLATLCKRYLEFALNHREYYEVMFTVHRQFTGATDQEGAEARATGHDSFLLLEAGVQNAIKKGYFKNAGESSLVTLTLWTQLHGLAMLAIKDRLPNADASTVVPLLLRSAEFSVRSLAEAAGSVSKSQ